MQSIFFNYLQTLTAAELKLVIGALPITKEQNRAEFLMSIWDCSRRVSGFSEQVDLCRRRKVKVLFLPRESYLAVGDTCHVVLCPFGAAATACKVCCPQRQWVHE